MLLQSILSCSYPHCSYSRTLCLHYSYVDYCQGARMCIHTYNHPSPMGCHGISAHECSQPHPKPQDSSLLKSVMTTTLSLTGQYLSWKQV